MATLAGNTIASTYPLLLKIDSNGIDGTLRAIQDGDATDSAVKISTKAVSVTGALSSDTQTTPETILTLGSTYSSTGSDGGAGSGSRLEFHIPDDDTNPITGSAIAGLKENADDGISSSALAFYTSQDDTTLDEAMRINSTGKVGIGSQGSALIGYADAAANNLVVGSSTGDEGITIISGASAGDYGALYFGDANLGTNGRIMYEQNNEIMSFYTNSIEKMRILLNGNMILAGGELQNSSGEFTIRNTASGENISLRTYDNAERLKIHSGGNVEVKTGDLVIGTSGKGISFAATADGTTMSSELLDDYEEGAWTPQFFDASSGGVQAGVATATGIYVKVGSLVHLTCEINVNSLSGVTMGNAVFLRNLPFPTKASTSNMYPPIVVGYATALNISAGVSIAGYLEHNGGSFGTLTAFDHAGGITDLTFTELSDNANLTMQMTYRSTS